MLTGGGAGVTVAMAKADAAFADVADPGKLIGLARDADQKKGGKVRTEMPSAFHAQGNTEKSEQGLMTAFTDQGFGGRQPSRQGGWGPGGQLRMAASRAFFPKRHHGRRPWCISIFSVIPQARWFIKKHC